jgi:cystathionine beta-lyase/cystathionine gamma-synthase
VVVSLTKYYGAGTAIAGAILTSDKIIFNDIQRFCRLIGCHTSPVHAKLILEQLPSLQERVKRASIITVQVVKTLDEQKVRVCHPSIEKHPSHAITKQFLRTWPAVFTFLVRGQKSTIQQVLAKSKFMEYKTSFGARKSRFDTFPKKHGTDILCRVAVGDLDSPDTIVQAVLDVIHRANIHTIPHQTKSLSNIE